ncbi:MAG: EVE domain-containing protein [Candidatus Methanomethyliales bacterium]|nr:EVE domain-containing protein [Candidatus Methanomethylicales archaeon]
MNYWLCVTNEDNWKVVRKHKVWGVPEKRGRHQIEAVKPGDFLVFYVIPKRFGGIFKAVSESFESREKIFYWADFGREEIFPFRVKLEPVIVPDNPLFFDELVKKLSFTRGLKRWSIRLRRAMFKISPKDFEVIRSYVEG